MRRASVRDQPSCQPDSLDPAPNITASAAIIAWTLTSRGGIPTDRRKAGAVDILVNNVWGGYERMVDNGEFTWAKPFWEQPLWRWDAMFSAGVRAHYHASQLAAPG